MEVCTSSINGSGEGLKAKRNVSAGKIVAYYHGVRMKAHEENPFGSKPTGYAIYLEWDREKRDNSDVLDISPEVSNTKLNLSHDVNFSTSQLKTTRLHWLTKSTTASTLTVSGSMSR